MVLSLVWGTMGDFEQNPLQVKRKPLHTALI